ncbi:MAG: hypothetical protein ACI8PT_001336 [Gammaproteobacteria bacterium]|jgi:hypothetical protein
MSTEVERIVYGCMDIEKSLRLSAGFITEIETEVEPHRVLNDVGREPMALIRVGARIHSRILAQRQLICQHPVTCRNSVHAHAASRW